MNSLPIETIKVWYFFSEHRYWFQLEDKVAKYNYENKKKQMQEENIKILEGNNIITQIQYVKNIL